jgi:subfamily B ATP-binding cassette protein MsbA
MNSTEQYLRLLQYVKPHWKTFAASIAATVVVALTEPATAALLKPLLDGSFVEKDPTMIVMMPLLLVALFLVRGLSTFISSVAMQSVASRVVFDLRGHLFTKLLTLPTSYFDNNSSGVVLSKVTYNAEQLTGAATGALIIMVRDTIAILGLLGWIIYLDWQLAMIALIQIPVIAILVKLISKRLRNIHRVLQRCVGEMTHVLEEVISGSRVVKLFGGQDYEKRRFSKSANKVRQYQMKNTISATLNVQMIQVLAVCSLALMAYLAAKIDFTVGEFMSFFSALALTLSPIKRLTGINATIQRGLAAADSVFTLLDHDDEENLGKDRFKRIRGKITFSNVDFKYPVSESKVIEDFSLDIQPGENVALVGPSGSGKTTLSSLLPRFYNPGQGKIMIEGIDIASVPLEHLRDRIALVSQDVVLFNDTVRANIAYGSTGDASEEEVREAARAANALGFIEEMPDGLDTFIGDNGVRLSGGQRQRIAIARALLKDSPILILDEATSSLDTESEKLIQDALENLRRGRTTIIIAHRLSTIEHADRIVVLDKGKIIEMGSHSELIHQDGLYQKLYQIQFAD